MKQAVVLAAGEGQRLRPFTVARPKVMLGIAGKPILQYVIEALAHNGIRKAFVVVGYRKEQVFDHFGDGKQFGVDIVYITQDRQLGTAHALAQTRDAIHDDFVVISGDNLIDADTIGGFVNAPPPAILLKQVSDAATYGVVTAEGGLVKEIVEKPAEAKSDLVNTGAYVFTREIFDLIGDELDIPGVVNKMLTRGMAISARETTGTWLDVVYPWGIVRLNAAILARIPAQVSGTIESGVSMKGAVSVGKGTIIRSNSYVVGPVVIGENCDIGPNVCILPATSVADNVTVSPFTTIQNSVIGSDVSIGPSSTVQDSVIDQGCLIRGHFTACSGEADVKVDEQHHHVNVGAMLGIGCSLGSGVVAQPGVILGNYAEVQAMKIIGGRIPDKAKVY